MPLDREPPVERLGFAALALLTLSPVVAHGLWRPIAVALHTDGDALSVTFAALVVGASAWVVHAWSRRRGLVALAVPWRPGAVAAAVAFVLGSLVGARGGVAPMTAAALSLLAVALFSGLLLPWIVPRLPSELDGLARRRKGATALVVLVGALAVVQTARLSTFMGDAARTELSAVPHVPFLVRHSCLTAYVEASRLAGERVDNVYDAESWPDLSGSTRSATYQLRYAPFDLDAFAYPPPFLLLPRFLLAPLGDFRSQRALWFAFNALSLAIGLWTVAAFVGGRGQVRALLLAPVVWLGFPTLVILQIGNVHATVIVLAVLAMVAFASNRPALGGAMLAFAILSKISPALLLVTFLVRRRFREALWTAGFGVAFVLVSVAVFGLAPFEAFVSYQMPRLSSGEALSFFTRDDSLPINMAPFGIPFKLARLGVQVGDPWKVARLVNASFSLALLGLAFVAARKDGSPRLRVMLWLGVLTLGTLRSPFAPGYVVLPIFWLFSLWAAEVRSRGGIVALALAWALLVTVPPLPMKPLLVFTLFTQSLLVLILAHVLLRTPPPETVER